MKLDQFKKVPKIEELLDESKLSMQRSNEKCGNVNLNLKCVMIEVTQSFMSRGPISVMLISRVYSFLEKKNLIFFMWPPFVLITRSR